jgi:RecJ-like exonuclease
MREKPCEECHGTGKSPATFDQCERCWGDGIEPDEPTRKFMKIIKEHLDSLTGEQYEEVVRRMNALEAAKTEQRRHQRLSRVRRRPAR